MGAKKIKKRRFVPDVARANRALRTIVASNSGEAAPGVAPAPVWALTKPLPGPDEPNAPIPAIRPELVDPVVIITDPHVVDDFEATGIRMLRMEDADEEKVLLWLIDKSRALEARNVDLDFAIDMGPDLKNRTMGATLARLAKKGSARVIATRDKSKVIVQMTAKVDEPPSAAVNDWLEYWKDRKAQ